MLYKMMRYDHWKENIVFRGKKLHRKIERRMR